MNLSQEQAEQLKIELLNELQQMLEAFDEPKKLSPDELSYLALTKISKYSKQFGKLANSLAAAGQSIESADSSSEALASGFGAASLAVSAYNFARIPSIYLAAYLLNQPVPFTFTNNLRWLYSASFLSLAITALAAPVTAPVIAFVSSGLVLGSSSFILGKVVYERYKLAKEKKALDLEIEPLKKQMLALSARSNELAKSIVNRAELSELEEACRELEQIKAEYELIKDPYETLAYAQSENEQLQEVFSKNKLIDKSVSFMLAATAVIGLVVSLFFPPAGLGILAAVASIGALYVVGRLLSPQISSFSRWLTNKKDSTVDNPDQVSLAQLMQKNQLDLDKILNPSPAHDSTKDALCLLGMGHEQEKALLLGKSAVTPSASADFVSSRIIASKPQRGQQEEEEEKDTDAEGFKCN